MSYQRLRCPRGHNFGANVYSKHQKIECPECRNLMRQSQDTTYSIPTFTASDAGYSGSDYSSSSSDSYYSGGGGDGAGGGSSGDW